MIANRYRAPEVIWTLAKARYAKPRCKKHDLRPTMDDALECRVCGWRVAVTVLRVGVA